jgi:phosphoadenosine phosphosulfate reductase
VLIEQTLFGEKDKVQIAIDRLKTFEPPEGYWLAFSGGKDSVVCYHLCKMAGVKFEAHYNITSVDPPELLRFIKREYPEVSRDVPRDKDGNAITMWTLIPKEKMPPTRLARYCCEKLKEGSGQGRIVVTGVRWAESARRKQQSDVVKGFNPPRDFVGKKNKYGGAVFNEDNDDARRLVEQCIARGKVNINPIVDWSDEEVWEFIEKYRVPYCELYDQGYTRLGCIGCPMNTNREAELKKYQHIRNKYLKAFEKMIEERKASGKRVDWETAEDVMNWWLEKTPPEKQIEGQEMME